MRGRPVTDYEEFLCLSQLDFAKSARDARRIGLAPDQGARHATTDNDDAHARLVMIATARLCGPVLRRLSARGRRIAPVSKYERR
jgi:hypothetical protein